jgi:hypothetical protein
MTGCASEDSRIHREAVYLLAQIRLAGWEQGLDVPLCDLHLVVSDAGRRRLFNCSNTKRLGVGAFFQRASDPMKRHTIAVDVRPLFATREQRRDALAEDTRAPLAAGRIKRAETRINELIPAKPDAARALRGSLASQRFELLGPIMHECAHACLAVAGTIFAHEIMFRSVCAALGSPWGISGPAGEAEARSWPQRKHLSISPDTELVSMACMEGKTNG